MRKAGSWIVAALLVVSALAAVWLRPERPTDPSDDESADSGEASRSDAGNTIEAEVRDLDPAVRQLVRQEQQPNDPGAPPLGDSTDAQKHVFAMTIRGAGYACPAVLSALPLSREGNSWRANCGELLLYWIDMDEFGRVSIEPGAYDDSVSPVPGGRTITIPAEEARQLQLR